MELDTNAEQTSTAEVTESKETQAPSQEPKRTEAEKAAFSLKKNAERVKELGLDPTEILGIKPAAVMVDANDEDSKPVTVGMLRELQKADARKSAIEMADEIADEATRNAVKEALGTRVAPSGNAEDDFRFALGAVSATKNKQVIEELSRYVAPKRTAAGGSQPANFEEEFTPTAQESEFMKAPYNLSKDDIIAARKRAAAKER